jgi:Ca2+-binding RTX toxin-like protein
VSASLTDDAGNPAAPANQTFILDTDADVAPLLAVSVSDTSIVNSEELAVSFTVAGLDSDATALVTFTDSAGQTVTQTVSANGNYAANLSSLNDGTITVSIVATDDAGNIATGTGTSLTLITSDPNDFDELALGTSVVVDPNGTVHGTPGVDVITAQDGGGNTGQTVYTGAGNDDIKGTGLADLIFGGSGDDKINGNNGADIIFGGSGNDTITGSNEDDILIGGFGADNLTGSNGSDTFVFLSTNDSRPDQFDTIRDFNPTSDKIDLTGTSIDTDIPPIDANTNEPGHQSFLFAGQKDTYTVVANSVTYYYDSTTQQTFVLADTDGNTAAAELQIALAGNITLTENNFILS